MRRDRRRRRRRAILLLFALALLLWWCHRPPPLALGTFNIRTFPGKSTDPAAVAAAIAELDADAFAVQEIRDVAAFEAALRRASELAERRYAAALSPYCRGRKAERLNLGVVYDAARVEMLAHRPLTAGDTCPQGQPPATLTLLRPRGGPPLALASVHLQHGGRPVDLAERVRQWTWLTGELPRLQAELAAPVVVAGDFNSTGFLEPRHAERVFIDEQLAAHGLQLPTAGIGCSMYWKPGRRYEVSLLDHVLAPRGLEFTRAQALGMCAELACAPQDRAPPDYHAVSDHCPVRVELRR